LRNCGQTISRFAYLENRAAHAPMLHTSQSLHMHAVITKAQQRVGNFFEGLLQDPQIFHTYIRPIIQAFGINLTTAIENCFVFNYDVGTIEQHLLHVNKEITDVLNIINLINKFFCASDKRSYSSEV